MFYSLLVYQVAHNSKSMTILVAPTATIAGKKGLFIP
jgi:hypothetical protein